MENYNFIKGYLEAFPHTFTVGQLLDNINKAEDELCCSVETQRKSMESNVGKCYYLSSEDEDENGNPYIALRSYIKITGVQDCYKHLLYTADLIEVTDWGVNYIDAYTLEDKDLSYAKEVDKAKFEEMNAALDDLLSMA